MLARDFEKADFPYENFSSWAFFESKWSPDVGQRDQLKAIDPGNLLREPQIRVSQHHRFDPVYQLSWWYINRATSVCRWQHLS